MGVNFIFNGYIFHFAAAASLTELLDQTADSVEETKKMPCCMMMS